MALPAKLHLRNQRRRNKHDSDPRYDDALLRSLRHGVKLRPQFKNSLRHYLSLLAAWRYVSMIRSFSFDPLLEPSQKVKTMPNPVPIVPKSR